MLKESAKRMVVPIASWNKIRRTPEQVAGLLTVGKVAGDCRLKGTTGNVQILLML